MDKMVLNYTKTIDDLVKGPPPDTSAKVIKGII